MQELILQKNSKNKIFLNAACVQSKVFIYNYYIIYTS